MSQRLEKKDYPLWVRLGMRWQTTRVEVWASLWAAVVTAAGCAACFAVSFVPGAGFTDVGRYVSLLGGFVLLLSALWSWRAMRWVDRYGTWGSGHYLRGIE